jgi:chemotaxis protein MotB
VGCLGLVAGCDDAKQRVAMLEESNQQLADQLNKLRDQLAQCEDGNRLCQNELAAARNEATGLRDQMAVQPKPLPPPEGWTQVPGGGMIAIEESVLFASGKAQVRGEARTTLDRIVAVLQKEYADKEIYVFGHTDSEPIKHSNWKDNLQLSTERAAAVVRHLQTKGIAPDRVLACGAGEHRPVVANDSAKNKQRNRRVEIFALDKNITVASAKTPK